MDNLQETCFGNNILEIWNYDQSIISQLSQQDIINDINKPSPNSLTNYSTLLGRVLSVATHFLSGFNLTLLKKKN